MSVRKTMEKVGDSNCYVVDAELDVGSFTFWFDPNKQYHIVKMKAVQKKGHVQKGGTPFPEGWIQTHELYLNDFKNV